MPTKQLLISGKVQGVFYRASARDKAVALGLNGWVRNTREGQVEALATGTEEQLAMFIAWCRQGPPRAVVTSVEVTEVDEKTIEGFTIRR